MNLQTTKPRAKWAGDSWWIVHPATGYMIQTTRPHDGAITLLRQFVLPRMTERRASC